MNDSPVDEPTPNQVLLRLAQRVRDSAVLGRSRRISGLFDFLVDCAVHGRVPKEIEVAIDGFGRSPSFDASKNALVRVHVHKLRAKLEDDPDAPRHIVTVRGSGYRFDP